MKTKFLVVVLTIFAVIALSPSRFEAAVPRLPGPIPIITAEYTPYEVIMSDEIVGLFKKYGFAINLCVRENQFDPKLDKLYGVYEKAGVRILFWPLLPVKDGLYLNKATTTVYLNYMDRMYAWADEHGHHIDALVVDIEPSYIEPVPGKKPEGTIKGFNRIRKTLDEKTFQASIPEFQKIIDKAHAHDTIVIAATFPFVIDDRIKGRHAWEDLFGGPVATLDWDYLAVMMYTSWFVESGKRFGVDWDAAHYLAYEYSLDLKRMWGEKAAVAVGVTNPGTGHEKVIYTSAEQIAPAIAAVSAAGIENLGIYDLKGILDSGNPESWFRVLANTPPAVPQRGQKAARRFRNIFKFGGGVIELMR